MSGSDIPCARRTLARRTDRVRSAGRQGCGITRLADGAFAAGNAGDSATHDRLVIEAVERIAESVDVICLAQVSMALLRAQAQAKSHVPVLTSPATAVARLKLLLNG